MDEKAWLIDYTARDPARIWTDEHGEYRNDLNELTPNQRVYLVIWGLEGEVGNGGFEQFIANGTGDTAELVPGALWRIEAFACAALVERALRSVSSDPLPTDQEERNALLGERYSEVCGTLKDLSRAFFAEPDDLTRLLYRFIHAHPRDFGLAE